MVVKRRQPQGCRLLVSNGPGTDVQLGLGVPQSDIIAFAWFLKATRQGSPAVQHFVGFMYGYGEGIPQDLSKALFYLTKSADLNQADAQYEIGTMYLHGQGVPKNYLTAKGWFVKAVKYGCEEAEASLSQAQKLIDKTTRRPRLPKGG